MRPALQVALLAAAMAAVTGIAELAGAINLGTALSFGQIGFVLTLAAMLLRR